MTKAELIERIVRSRELPSDLAKKVVAQVVDLAFEELAEYFAKTRITRSSTPRFSYPGFGTFTKKKRRARMGVNPRTLEPMAIEESCTIDFRPAASLKATMTDAVKISRAKSSKTAARRSADAQAAVVERGKGEELDLVQRHKSQSLQPLKPEANGSYQTTQAGADAAVDLRRESRVSRSSMQENSQPSLPGRSLPGRSVAATRLAALLESDAFMRDDADVVRAGSRSNSKKVSTTAAAALPDRDRGGQADSGGRRQASARGEAAPSAAVLGRSDAASLPSPAAGAPAPAPAPTLPELGLRRTSVPSRTNRRSGMG